MLFVATIHRYLCIVCLFCRVTLVASHHAVVTINVIVYILLVDDYYYV